MQNTAIKKAMTHNLCDAPAEIQNVITKAVGAKSLSMILASPFTLSDIFLDSICKKVSNLFTYISYPLSLLKPHKFDCLVRNH